MKYVIYILLLLIFAGACAAGYWFFIKDDRPIVASFEECLAAGYPVAESFPRQCKADGKTYIEDIDAANEQVQEEQDALVSDWYLCNEDKTFSVIIGNEDATIMLDDKRTYTLAAREVGSSTEYANQGDEVVLKLEADKGRIVESAEVTYGNCTRQEGRMPVVEELTLAGSITAIDTETATDTEAVITIDSNGQAYTIALLSEETCADEAEIIAVSELAEDDVIEVRGTKGLDDRIVPCLKGAHYLREVALVEEEEEESEEPEEGEEETATTTESEEEEE